MNMKITYSNQLIIFNYVIVVTSNKVKYAPEQKIIYIS